MSGSVIAGLVRRSSFIFAGTVASVGQSSLRALPAQPGLAVARFDRGFRVDPVLGKLDGRPITVRTAANEAAAGTLRPGQRFIFFTTAWVHAEHIAVAELGRLPADGKTEEEVDQAVAALPEQHLAERVQHAVLIVHGVVASIARAPDVPRTGSEHDPFWMRAVIEVSEVLKGEAGKPTARSRAQVVLLFPGSQDRAFRNAPRPHEKQEAIFLLHAGAGVLPPEARIAPDPADIQPPRARTTIRRLIGAPAPG